MSNKVTNVVEVEHLNVVFGDFYAVKDVSFTVQGGEIFGFLGANGAGKTTTIRVLCGLLVPSSGRVIVDQQPVISGQENLVKQKVGYMSQKFTLYDDLTIEENMEFASALRAIPSDQFKKRKQELLAFIGFNQKPNTLVRELPGGIKQEIALIVSILHNPKIVFLDEPTAGVAPMARARFWELINQLSEEGKTIFVTTHYMDEAENCNRIALMRSGELIALDSPVRLKESTFDQQIYLVTPLSADNRAVFLQKIDEISDTCEAYGHHFHVIFKKQVSVEQIIEQWRDLVKIVPVNPSLEDVFVKLVEGDR